MTSKKYGPWTSTFKWEHAAGYVVERPDGSGFAVTTEDLDEAKVIVAAPEMLSALEGALPSLLQLCEGQHPDNLCCHALRSVVAAITKAGGQLTFI